MESYFPATGTTTREAEGILAAGLLADSRVDQIIALAEPIQDLLVALGEDGDDENLRGTPRRAAFWFAEFVRRPEYELEEELGVSFPNPGYDQAVAVSNVSFTSLCAHHLLPFRGMAHLTYIPKERVFGLSKLARIVHFYAHRLTLQEAVTGQIAHAIERHLKPHGCMVVLKARHECMSLRGIHEADAVTITSAVTGFYLENQANCKDEFLSLIQKTEVKF
jgi:GTP cyclohydrolase I